MGKEKVCIKLLRLLKIQDDVLYYCIFKLNGNNQNVNFLEKIVAKGGSQLRLNCQVCRLVETLFIFKRNTHF